MSYTTDLVSSLATQQIKKNCCRRAWLTGLLLASENRDGELHATFRSSEAAESAEILQRKLLRGEGQLSHTVRAGRACHDLTCKCTAVAELLSKIDKGIEEPIHELLDYRCSSCASYLVRGAFCAVGSLSDPHKSYHLEMTLPTKERADLLSNILADIVGAPGRIKRPKGYALYYKSNEKIFNFLNYIGGRKHSNDFLDTYVSRDFRNAQNRATNCDARNIAMAVKTAQKQIAAIEALIESGGFESLPKELQYTARLRMEYDSIPLSELAALHDPPITKSGLNRRLSKLIELAMQACP